CRVRSVVEKKLFGIDQSPKDILVGLAASGGRFLFVFAFDFLFQITVGQFHFLRIGVAGVNPRIEFANFLRIGALFVHGQQGGAALIGGEFLLDFLGVEQMEALSQAGILGALALAGTR